MAIISGKYKKQRCGELVAGYIKRDLDLWCLKTLELFQHRKIKRKKSLAMRKLHLVKVGTVGT